MDTRKVLIVAHKTVLGPPLRAEIERLKARGPCRFVLLVPSDPPPGNGIQWSESDAWNTAHRRAGEGADWFRSLGCEVQARVGGYRPYDAILDVLHDEAFDDIVISTLPLGISAWLGMDLPHRIARETGTPVHHVIFDPTHPERAEPETHLDANRPFQP